MGNTAESNNTTQQKKSKARLFDYLRFGESYTSLILGIVVVIVATILLLSFIRSKNAANQQNNQATLSQQTQRNIPDLARETQMLKQTQSPSSISATLTQSPTQTPTPTVAKKATPTAVPTKVAKEKPTATPVPTKAKATATPKPTVVAKKISPTPVQTVDKQVKSKGTYTIVHGDNLWNIAEKQYKSGYNWVDIARANKLLNANAIHVGNKLVIPDVEPKVATVKQEVKKETDKKVVQQKEGTLNMQSNKISGNEYAVAKGDTLWSIAVRAYGDGYQWKRIAEANKLANPHLIFSGNKLKIPRTG